MIDLGASGALTPERAPVWGVLEPDQGVAPLLDVWGVRKSWRKQVVLDGLEFEVNPGAAVHISGRNGCGKTTLLRIIIGLIRAEAGEVRAFGLDPVRDRRRFQQRVGFLPAGDRGLYARIDVRGHLRFWARIGFVPRAQERDVIDQAMTRFALHELSDRRTDRLSQGQRQRLRLAGTFLLDPDLVLLDEPRNSLDDEGIGLLRGRLEELLARGGAIVWCSPTGETTDLEFSCRYALESGRLRRR